MSGSTFLPVAAEPVPALAGALAEPKPPGRAVRLRQALFGGPVSGVVTVLLGLLLLRALWGILDWGVFSAVWSVPVSATGTPDPSVCKTAAAGACWAAVGEKYRLVLFGVYPYGEQWRPLIVLVVFVGLYIASSMRRCWRPMLAGAWAAGLIVVFGLMWGGVLGLTYVSQDQWGGLPITLILATFGLVLAFPLAVIVALGRRARSLPAVRILCIVYVELIRGVPLISVLFMATLLLPLFLPEGLSFDKLLCAQVGIILFAAAYLAEVVRGGLQALPAGQAEAANALGLSYWQKTLLIELPQALRIVIPPLVNTALGLFKDTSLVAIVGILDLTRSAEAAISDPVWSSFSTEIFLFIAVIYFAFCFAMSRYSHGLERSLSRNRKR